MDWFYFSGLLLSNKERPALMLRIALLDLLLCVSCHKFIAVFVYCTGLHMVPPTQPPLSDESGYMN